MSDQGNRFVIQELMPKASAYTGGALARFEWDVAHRNMPFRPIGIGAVELRTKKTLYPGTAVPSEQVFGSNPKDLQVQGEWSDKWNYTGYAEETRDAFEAMVRRGNQVSIDYRTTSLVGLIVDFTPDTHDTHRVGYSFRVSLHDQRDRERKGKRLYIAALDPMTALLKAKLEVFAMQMGRPTELGTVSFAPPSLLGSSFHARAAFAVRQLAEKVDDAISFVERFTVDPLADVSAALMTVASTFAIIRGRSQQTIDLLASARSDQQASMTAVDAANFEEWRLGVLVGAWRVMNLAYEGERQAVSHAQPDALYIHEAKRGENLMGLALRYYGNADAWTAIAERNGIEDFTLHGGELLVIPAGGGG